METLHVEDAAVMCSNKSRVQTSANANKSPKVRSICNDNHDKWNVPAPSFIATFSFFSITSSDEYSGSFK